MWTKSRSLLLSRIMVAVFMVLLIAVSLALPFMLRWYIGYSGSDEGILLPALAGLWACVLPAFAALLCLGRMLKNIASGLIFVRENVKFLRIISWCCFAVAFILLCALYYSVLCLGVAVLAAFAGLILRVVKNVFEQAVEIKEESDLTV